MEQVPQLMADMTKYIFYHTWPESMAMIPGSSERFFFDLQPIKAQVLIRLSEIDGQLFDYIFILV